MEKGPFVISYPPTGAEVEELAYRMMSTSGLLELMVRSEPAEATTPEPFIMRINQHSTDSEGVVTIAGRSTDNSAWTTVLIAKDSSLPATGYQD